MINVGGTTYKKLLREGRLPAVPASSLAPIPIGAAAGAAMVKGHGIEPTEASVLPPYHEQVDENSDEARKEEVNIANTEKMRNMKSKWFMLWQNRHFK